MTTPERIGLPEPAMNALRQYPNYWFNVDANGIVTAHTTPPLQGEGMGEAVSSMQLARNITNMIFEHSDVEAVIKARAEMIAAHTRVAVAGWVAATHRLYEGYATHPPASANPVTPSVVEVENVAVRIAEIARDMRDKPAEDFCEAIESIIQAHTDAGVDEAIHTSTNPLYIELQARNAALEEALKLYASVEDDNTIGGMWSLKRGWETPDGQRIYEASGTWADTVSPARQALANKEATHE